MNRDPRDRNSQREGRGRPSDPTRGAEAGAREAVVAAWRRALCRMRERRAAQDRTDPSG